MNKAIFLDRDGVINRERGEHTWLPRHFEILPTVAPALKLLQDAGWLLVVITNQSGIGLGLYDHAHVRALHDLLEKELARSRVQLTGILYCPHHPQQGRCSCRKPGSLLLEKALARYQVDPRLSIMIGDRDRDISAAASAGIRGILVPSNSDLLRLVKDEIVKG
jgi:D-glycero-D-manno-heptose 1,7-bisphosphate phosphatase